MLTTQIYKNTIKPDTYSDALKERIDRTLEMQDVVYPVNNFCELIKSMLWGAWVIDIIMCVFGFLLNCQADYFILVVGFGVAILFGIFFIQSSLSSKYKVDKMLIRYFDNLKDNEVYKYFGVLEELFAPKVSENSDKKSYFVKIDGKMWQVNKEDYDKVEKLKTHKVNLYFVKYNNLGENAIALMVEPEEKAD